MKNLTRAVLFTFAAVALVGAAQQGTTTDKKSSVTSIDELKFTPLDAKNPDGPQMAPAWGDPWTGPTSIYLKLKPGANPLHSHSSTYHAVVVKGRAKHWDAGGDEKSAKIVGPGSSWYQPGNAVHGDACVGPEECVIYITLSGKFDFIPAAK